LTRLENYVENHLKFAEFEEVPFTNNLSERSLRRVKTKMKVSGLFQNIAHAEYSATIMSYAETAKRLGNSLISAFQSLSNRKPLSLAQMKGESE